MDITVITEFFMWCTILNGALLIFWTIMVISTPSLVYRTQTKWIPISRETFNTAMYSFLGLFKIFFLVFNVVPYFALLIVT